MRATRQLSRLLGCEPTWTAVRDARTKLEYEELCRRCFDGQNVHALLLDEGLSTVKLCERPAWHAKLTSGGGGKDHHQSRTYRRGSSAHTVTAFGEDSVLGL